MASFRIPNFIVFSKAMLVEIIVGYSQRRNYGPDERTLAEPFHPRICSGNSPDDDVGICGIAACALSNNCARSASIEQLPAQLSQRQHSACDLRPVRQHPLYP